MYFLVDAQLPPALARYLVSLGYQSDHVADLGMLSASDQEIWQVAERKQAVIVTKDEDFVFPRNRSDAAWPRVLWLRVGNTRKGQLLSWFERLLPEITAALDRGEVLVEVV